jgi:uncharacterized protein YutE (UPF0331/DUF86 family)
MPRRRVTFPTQSFSLFDVAAYHRDTDASLRVYFADVHPKFSIRFTGYLLEEVIDELTDRLDETDRRSSLAVLSHVEAAFRVDYLQRCQKRKRDSLSKVFRVMYKNRGISVRLEDDIFEAWRRAHPLTAQLISELRGAFKFRHWLAHGSYWTPKLGRKYDYQSIYALADSALASFPLFGPAG